MQSKFGNQEGGEGHRSFHDVQQVGLTQQPYPFSSNEPNYNGSFSSFSRPSSSSGHMMPNGPSMSRASGSMYSPGHYNASNRQDIIRTPPSGIYHTSSPNSSANLGFNSNPHRGSIGGDSEGMFAHASNPASSSRSNITFQQSLSSSFGHHMIPNPKNDSPQGSHQPSKSSTTSPGSDANQRHSGATPLRRGQACQTCRRRKLKCDAQRPICGTCEKSRKAAALANHASPVPEGDCVYDDPLTNTTQQNGTGTPTAQAKISSPAKQPESTSSPSLLLHSSGLNPTATASDTGLDNRHGPAFKRQRTGGHGTGSIMRDSATFSRGGKSGMNGNQSTVKENVRESVEQKAARLENRVAELEEKLRQARAYGVAGSASQHWETGTTPHRWRSRANSREPDSDEGFRPAVPIISMLSPLSGREERHRMRYSQRPSGYDLNMMSNTSSLRTGMAGHTANKSTATASSNGSVKDFDTETRKNPNEVETDPTLVDSTNIDPITSSPDESFMQLLWPGWSSDLPSSETVTSLCDIFFRLHPLRTLVYKPTFMTGLLLPVKHPHRPHDSLIHAIMCAASDISPYHEDTNIMNGVRDKFCVLLADPFSRPNVQQASSPNALTFKEFHLSKARQKIERSLMTDFRNPLDWLCAGTIAVYVLWNEGRFVEAYFLSGFVARAMAPAGLDKLPSQHFSPSGKVGNAPGLFGDAHGLEAHERRIVLWHAFLADQYTSGPPGFYENLIHEQAVLTHLPCSTDDFLAGNNVPPNSQTLSSSDLFTTGHLDDFTLHIKSAVLLRRVSTLSSRSQFLRSKPAGVPIMDKQIDEFIASLPSKPWYECSSDGWNAHANISLALFYLHEPYLARSSLCSVKEAETVSSSANGRILFGVERVMELLHQLVNSSLDFALLHAQMFLTWSVCARMMGKDLLLLQKRIQKLKTQGLNEDSNVNGAKKRPIFPNNANMTKHRLADEENALNRVMENLMLIIQALRRAGVKSVKARRCSELVSLVRSGHLHEALLSHLLYLDGVIPVEQDENNGQQSDPSAAFMALSQHPAFDAMLQSGGMPTGGMNAIPLMMSMMSDPSHQANISFLQDTSIPEVDFNAFATAAEPADSTQVVADLLSEPFLVEDTPLTASQVQASQSDNDGTVKTDGGGIGIFTLQ